MAASTVSDITSELPSPRRVAVAESKLGPVAACQLKVFVTPVVCHVGGLQVSVEFSVGVIDKPTTSIDGQLYKEGEAGIVMLTSLTIFPLRLLPATTHVYLVSE